MNWTQIETKWAEMARRVRTEFVSTSAPRAANAGGSVSPIGAANADQVAINDKN